MSLIAKAFVRVIRQLIGFEIEYGNRLHGKSLLRSVTIVQQSGITAVWAQRYRGGKAIGAADASGRGNFQNLAGRERDRRRVGRTVLRHQSNRKSDECK